jgi:hypothetical protein
MTVLPVKVLYWCPECRQITAIYVFDIPRFTTRLCDLTTLKEAGRNSGIVVPAMCSGIAYRVDDPEVEAAWRLGGWEAAAAIMEAR